MPFSATRETRRASSSRKVASRSVVLRPQRDSSVTSTASISRPATKNTRPPVRSGPARTPMSSWPPSGMRRERSPPEIERAVSVTVFAALGPFDVPLGQARAEDFDALIVAVGRKARLSGYGLEDLGIARKDGGEVETDPRKIWKRFADHWLDELPEDEAKAVPGALQHVKTAVRHDAVPPAVLLPLGPVEGHRLRLLPHRHGTDGFFAAVWRRR